MNRAVNASPEKSIFRTIIDFFRPKHPSEMTDEEWFDELAWWYQF